MASQQHIVACSHYKNVHSLVGTRLNTVYIGGGTPTALPSLLLCKILDKVQQFPLTPDVEITVEANPGTLNREYQQALKAHGVNRLSLGLQTTHSHLLAAINRAHSMEDFLENYHTACEIGFDNINIDLMFALPGQTIADWQKTLQEIIALSPAHISAYSLTPAENTPLWESLEKGGLTLPTDDIDRAMYHMAIELLTNAGYIHYELSNFAKPGFESRHNVNCWRCVPYYAFGLGAHSFDGQKRWRNTASMAKYLEGDYAPRDVVCLTDAERLSEEIILGLRLTLGIPEKLPDVQIVENLIGKGLLTRQNGFVKLTPKGLDLANLVFEAFLV